MTLLAQLFFCFFFLFGKKLSQYDDIEPVRCPELVRCHWASTMTLSQYDDTDSTVRPTFLVGPSEMKENDSFYHPQNSPWQQSFWFLSSDYIRTLENWASKEIWDGTQNEVDWVQKDSIKIDRFLWALPKDMFFLKLQPGLRGTQIEYAKQVFKKCTHQKYCKFNGLV